MVIDTSAYSALQQGHPSVANQCRRASMLSVPVVVVGELRYGFRQGTRTQDNEAILQRFLASQSVEVVDITVMTTVSYAELYGYARSKGRALSHNDFWIAATALERNEELITLDKDFEVFRPLLGKKLHIYDT